MDRQALATQGTTRRTALTVLAGGAAGLGGVLAACGQANTGGSAPKVQGPVESSATQAGTKV